MLAPIIIYEDNHLLIVQKPPGFLSQPDGGSRPDLLGWAGEYLARHKPGRAFVGLVHRLDRSVGGVVALAKTSKAAARLSQQFRDRSCEKIYLALVSGLVSAPEGQMEDSLVRDGSFTRRASPTETGKPGRLSWRLRETISGEGASSTLSLLEVNLLTGFKHQIRAQLALRGWPIVGDHKYQSRPGGAIPRPAQEPPPAIGLWAESLSIEHPTKKERLTFTSSPVKIWPWSLLCPRK